MTARLVHLSSSHLRSVFLAALALWAAVVVLWPGSSNRSSDNQGNVLVGSGEGLYKAPLTSANLGMLKARFFESRDGRKHWQILSQFAEMHRAENYVFLRGIEADFYAQKTGNVIHTKSLYGRSWTEKELVELEGDVLIRSERGYLFSMDRLNYWSNTHRFESKTPVQMRGPDIDNPSMYLQGVGLEADIDEERFILRKDVTARRKLQNNEWMRIQSRTGEFFTAANRAVFSDKAVGTLRELSIEGNRLELMMSEGDESIFAKGNVRLKSRNRVGRGEKALIKLDENTIVLEGQARVDSGPNVVLGKKITLYTDDDRIEVESAQGRVTP